MPGPSPRPYVLGATLADARAYIADHAEFGGAGAVAPGTLAAVMGRVDVGLPLAMTTEFNALIAAGDRAALELEATMKRNAAKRKAR